MACPIQNRLLLELQHPLLGGNGRSLRTLHRLQYNILVYDFGIAAKPGFLDVHRKPGAIWYELVLSLS